MSHNKDLPIVIREIIKNCPLALQKVDSVLAEAIDSGKHKPFDWKKLGIDGNLNHLDWHRTDLRENDISEDHLANIACRALFALQLREEQKK
jgi:hypothetical protein